MKEKLITGMCFGFLTNVSTVHACDMITHLRLSNKWLVEMTIPYLQCTYLGKHLPASLLGVLDETLFLGLEQLWTVEL